MTLRPMSELPTANGDYIVASVRYLELGGVELGQDRFTVTGGWKRIADGCEDARRERERGIVIGAAFGRRRVGDPEPDFDHAKDCEGPHYIGWSPIPEPLEWAVGWENVVRTKLWGPPGSKAKKR